MSPQTGDSFSWYRDVFLGIEIFRSSFRHRDLSTSNLQEIEAPKQQARVDLRKKTIWMVNNRMQNVDAKKEMSMPKRRCRYQNRDLGHLDTTKKISIPKKTHPPQTLLIFAVGVECGENRGRTGGGIGGEPGAPKRTGGEPGAFGKRTRGEPGAFGIHLQRVPGEKRGLWDKNRGRTGGRETCCGLVVPSTG